MYRYQTYSLEDVFSAMDRNESYLPDGRKFGRNSSRLILFKTKGVECVSCDKKGNVFILESSSKTDSPHLNLYSQDTDGNLMLMTKDHIKPRSRGGADHIDNYQTMCTKCNTNKADKY